MTDKARKEFNNWLANEAPMVIDYEDVWLAAKERYEPKACPVEQGHLKMVFSIQQQGKIKQVNKIIPLMQIATSNLNEVARYADQCCRELAR